MRILGAFQGRSAGARRGRANFQQKIMCDRVLSKIKCSVLAPTYSPLSSTISTTRLNFRVRNENGCDPRVEAPKQTI